MGKTISGRRTGPHAGKCLAAWKNRIPVGSEPSNQREMVAGKRLRQCHSVEGDDDYDDDYSS